MENNNAKDFLELYKTMKRIRLFEEKVNWLFSRGRLGGTTHLCIGQEAAATGVVANLRQDDYVVSSHRGHGHLIAKGGSPQKMFSELMGKVDGYCQGKGGTQHLCAKDIGFYGTNGITGGGIPIATGIALSIKLRKTDQIAVCFFGDGATNQGTFHESLNMAATWQLPILYVCENNLYGMSTSIKTVTSVEDLVQRAQSYNIENCVVDGMDVLNVLNVSKDVIDRVRTEKRPFFLEVKTYRYCGHSKSDPRVYRTKDEEQNWQKKDGIESFKNRLISEGMDAQTFENVDREINQEIEVDLAASEQSQDTPESLATEGVYSDG